MVAMFIDTPKIPIKSTYAPVHEKIEHMCEEYKARRLASLNRKMMMGLLTTAEMYERETLAA